MLAIPTMVPAMTWASVGGGPLKDCWSQLDAITQRELYAQAIAPEKK
jgi:hypothetical protein